MAMSKTCQSAQHGNEPSTSMSEHTSHTTDSGLEPRTTRPWQHDASSTVTTWEGPWTGRYPNSSKSIQKPTPPVNTTRNQHIQTVLPVRTSCYGGAYESCIFDRFGEFSKKPLRAGISSISIDSFNKELKLAAGGPGPMVCPLIIAMCCKINFLQ